MRKYVFISMGGIIGAVLRYLIKSIPLEHYNGNLPVNTLLINITGSFIIAFVLTAANDVLKLDADLKTGIATGFIGAYTTFSTLCKETANLISQGHYFSAVFYVTVSALLGIAAVYAGITVAGRTGAALMKKKEKQKENTFSDKKEAE